MAVKYMIDIATVQLIRETCCNCGVVFAMAEEHYNEFRNDSSKSFYCPNGHGQHYTTSEVTKQKRRAERAEAALQRAYDERDTAERRRRAEKGAKTRIKNRIANGVCPCCNRYFVNLHKHMAGQHPGYSATGGAE